MNSVFSYFKVTAAPVIVVIKYTTTTSTSTIIITVLVLVRHPNNKTKSFSCKKKNMELTRVYAVSM